MSSSVIIHPSRDDCEIRLRLRLVNQFDGTLVSNLRSILESRLKGFVEPGDTGCVSGADRRHPQDFPFDELHALIGLEEARFRHAVELFHGESAPDRVGLQGIVSEGETSRRSYARGRTVATRVNGPADESVAERERRE
jgi:hypothetical protein